MFIKKVKEKLKNFPFLLDMKHRSLDRKMAGFFKQFTGTHGLFFDIGANFGNRTREFTLLNVRVVAVEPQDDCVAFLNKRFRGEDVIVVHGAVGAEEKTAELSICEDSGCSTFSDEWKTGRFAGLNFGRTQKTSMGTLEGLIREFGIPDFCKIDVEGYEEEVLKGLKTKIPVLNFEFLPERMDVVERCVAYLEGIGYTQFAVVSGEESVFTVPFGPKEGVMGFIRGSEDPDYWGDIYAR